MKVIDIILLVLVLVGAYLGYKKGLLIEILTFLAFIIAIISAFKLMHVGVSFLPESNGVMPYIAFVIIFIVVFVGIFLLGKLLKTIIDYSLLGDFDNWAGAILGACKMAFAVSLFLWLTHHSNITIPKEYTSESVIYPQLIPFAHNVVNWVSYVIPFKDIFPLIKDSLSR